MHTLPAPKRQQDTGNTEQLPEDAASTSSKPERERMPASTTTIPRLISVTEIIKREFLKTLPADEAQQNTLTGLHQYNELGILPEEPNVEPVDAEAERLQSLTHALTGKNQYVSTPSLST